MTRYSRLWTVFASISAVLCSIGSSVAVDPISYQEKIRMKYPAAPEAPRGYSSELAIKAAFALGQLRLVELPKTVPASVRHYPDVEYANIDGYSLRIDLFVPTRVSESVPCLMFIHGGGWSKGKKEDYLIYNLAFAERGYVTASVSYRLSQVAPFPAAVQDVKCAIRWLRANAANYHIDPSQIAAIGGSAGGHLALMAGLSDDPSLEGQGGHADQSSRVQAVVNFYGVTDATTEKAKNAHQVIDFIGGTYSEKTTAYHLCSPIEHVTSDDPPVLTFHGSLDELVPVTQATRLHAELDQAGVANALDILEGWPHTMDLQVDVNRRCQYIMTQFLQEYLPLPEAAAEPSQISETR